MSISHPAYDEVNASYWQQVGHLLTSWRYLVPLVATLIAAFSFFVSHPSISVDDLAGAKYLSGELVAQGRFTWTMITKLLGIHDNVFYTMDAVGIVLLAFSAVLLSALFISVSRGRFRAGAATVFSLLYVSCPLLMEAFIYSAMAIAIGGSGILVALSLHLIDSAGKHIGARKLPAYCGASVLLIFAISWYESLIVVYVCAVFLILLLHNQSDTTKKAQFSQALIEGLRYALVLVLAIVAEVLISNMVIAVWGLAHSSNAANTISLVESDVFKETLESWFYYYILTGLFYLPIALLDLGIIGIVVLAIWEYPRHHSPVRLLLYASMLFCLLILTLLSGWAAPYRTAQIVPFFIAVTWAMVYQTVADSCTASQDDEGDAQRKRWSGTPPQLRVMQLIICGLLVIQIVDINHWFVVDWNRYCAEQKVICSIGAKLEQNGLDSKPVVFTGAFHLGGEWEREAYLPSSDLRAQFIERYFDYDIVNTSGTYACKIEQDNEYITWAEHAFGGQSELYKFFDYCGYPLVAADATMYKNAGIYATVIDPPVWPASGSIIDRGDYLIINIGEND